MARTGYKAKKHMVGIARLPRAMLLRSTALQGIAVLCAVLPFDYVYAQPAPNAHPTGAVTQLGSGSYSYNGTTTTINQTSPILATGWQSFNVGSQQSVQINQPSASAVSVNRVLARDPSQIAGHINANGVFVLVNPNGVVFSQGAQVNAASVIVSTADVANKNLAAGKLVFDQPGKPGAMVINRGNISVKATGLAALVAPGVENSGVINAPFGRVAIAGAEASVVDLYGDGLMSIDVTKQVTTVPTGPDGKPVAALVTNSGVITAKGGRIELTAQAVDGVVTNLVDAGGKIKANTAINGKTGTVVINGIGGSISIEGDVSATGRAAGTTGGAIEVNASNAVNVAATARVNASGKAGGGTVAIGTSLARAVGGPSVAGEPTAKTVTIASGAQVKANATAKGSGGRVTVLSTDNTSMAGTISATGGKLGGDGGFVEVSGYQGFSLTGPVDVTAAMGNAGTILLDPNFLTVVSGSAGGADLDTTLDNSNQITVGNGGSNGTVSTGEIASLTGNIILQAGSILTFASNAAVTLKNNANLILTTGSGDIIINKGADITLKGQGSLTASAGTSGTGGITLNSDITTGASGSVLLNAAGDIALNGAQITTPVLDMSTTNHGNISQNSAGAITGVGGAAVLQSSSGIAGSLTLSGTGNAIGTVSSLAVTGNVSLVTGSNLVVSGTNSASGMFIATPTLTLGTGSGAANRGVLTAPGGTISISTDKLVAAANNSGTIAVAGGAIELAPKSGSVVAIGAGVTASIGSLGIDPTAVSLTGGTLRLGAISGTTVANSITIAGTTNLTTLGTVDFQATGGVTQSAALGGAVISGNVGSLTLTDSANAITAVGNFTAATGFKLRNNADLSIDGVLKVNSGSVVADAGSNLLSVSGTVIAPRATLAGGTVSVPGSLNISGLGSLMATSASIEATGQLTLGTLAATAAKAVSLTGPNAIGSIGNVTANGFTLSNGASLSIDGVLNAGTDSAIINNGTAGLVLSNTGTISVTSTIGGGVTLNAGSIVLNGSIDQPSPAGFVRMTATTGAITQAGTAHMTAGSLTGSAATQASFGGTNDIGALGAFSAGNGFTLIANAGSNLSQTGVLNGGTGAVLINNGTFQFTELGTVLGSSISISAGDIQAGSLVAPGLVVLNAGTGDVVGNGFINAGTLAGSAQGKATFTSGSIASVGSFITGTGFTLTGNTSTLAVNGLIEGNTGSVVLNNGTFGLSLGSAGTIHGIEATLAAGSISLGGTIGVSGLLNLVGSVGAITELASANVNAGTLTGSSGGSTALVLGSNTISALGPFTAGGSFALADVHALLVASPVSATAISLATPMLTLGDATTNAGTLTSSAGLISIQTGSFVVGTAGGTIDATSSGVIEFAPSTDNAVVVLGAGGAGTLAVDPSAAGLTLVDGTLRLGAVNGTTVAGSIVVAAGAGAYTIPGTLDLRASGGVTQSVALTAAKLTGSVGSVTLTDTNNQIAAIGAMTAPNGFTLVNKGGVDLAGALDVNAGTLSVQDDTGITLSGSATVTTALLSSKSLSISGTLSATSGTLFATDTGITETGVLNLGTLTGSVAATADLTGPNAIGTLGAFAADNLVLNNGSSDLSVAGVVSYGNSATIMTAGSLSVPGSILPVGVASSNVLILTGGPAINIGGVISDGGTGSTTLIANSGTGAITAGGTVIAGTLTGNAAIATLTGSANAIGTLASFASSQSLVVVDSTNLVAIGTIGGGSVVALQAPSLQLGDGATAAVLLSPNGAIGLRTDALSVGAAHQGTIAAGTGTLEIAGITRTIIAIGAPSASGRLGLDLTSLDITASTLRLGSFNGTPVAQSIEIDGSGDLHTQFGTLDLRAIGGITQSDSLIISTLLGNAGSVVLDMPTNQIGTLGGFSVANGFTLFDGASLSVNGQVGGAGSVVLDTGSLGLAIASGGRVTGGAIGLHGGSIDINGSLDTPGSLTLTSNLGTIAETTAGVIRAMTLSGSAADVVSLVGSGNAIGTIAGFSAVNGFTLTNTASLTTTGVLDASSGSVVINNGTAAGLAISGTITAMAASLSAGSIDLTGSLGVLNLASLTASSGAITQAGSAFLNVGTLAGSAKTTASLLGTNAVGTLGNFAADTLLLNAGTAGLTVAGTVTAGHTVSIATGGLLAVTGSIIPVLGSSLAITLSGDTLALGGLISDGGSGHTGLFATNGGTITETGSLIIGTLTGSASLADFSAGANAIAVLGDFNAGTLLLADTADLTISGGVTIGAVASIVDTGSITLSGSLVAASGSTIAIGMSGANIAITGLLSDGGAGTTSLTASFGVIDEAATGTIIAGLLTGGADVISLLGTGNAIATIDNLAAASTLVVVDGSSLTLSGTEMPSGLLSVAAPTLHVTGLVGAPRTTLVASTGSLVMDGIISTPGTGVVVLDGLTRILIDTGTIIGGGTVIATSGSGAVELTSPHITISAIGGSAATDFIVNDSASALTALNIDAGASVTLTTPGSLTVAGSIAPLPGSVIAIDLVANGIQIDGGVSDSGFGSTFLNAGTGSLAGAGGVVAGTLSAIGTVFGLTGQNTIATFDTLANFASIVLNDTGSLLIGGPISATTLVAINAGTLTVQNTIIAPSVTLSGTSGLLSLGSTIDASGNIALSGSAGIDGAAATLTGGGVVSADSAGGSIVLTNTANAVASISGTAHADFRFQNGASLGVGNVGAGSVIAIGGPAIGVTGTVGAPHVSLVAAGPLDIAFGARVLPSIDAMLVANAGLLSVEGVVGPASGNVALTLNGATIDISGLVNAGTGGLLNLVAPLASGTITETGTLIAGTLTGAAAFANLIDPGFSNQIGTLGSFTGQTLVFNDGTALTVAGPVSIGSVIAINDSSSISVTGTIAPMSGSVISVGLTATALTITGLVSDSGTGTTALVVNGGSIVESAGTLIAGKLSGTALSVGLTGAGNAIAELDGFRGDTAFDFVDSVALTVIGPAGGAPVVNVTAPSITLGDGTTAGTLGAASSGLLSIVTGTLVTAGLGGTLAAPTGVIEVAPAQSSDIITLGTTSSAGVLGFVPGSFTLDADVLRLGSHGGLIASAAITVGGVSTSVVNVATLDIRTAGTLSQGAALIAPRLTGTAAAVVLTNPNNNIGVIGAFSAPNEFALSDAVPLSVAGPLVSSGGTVVLDSGSFGLTVPGSISALAAFLSGGQVGVSGSLGVSGIASLIANAGSVSVTGTLNAQTLIGSATGTAIFAGVENVGTLGDFATGTGLRLTEAQPLLVSGDVEAPGGTVAINVSGFSLTVAGTIGGQGASLLAGDIDIPGVLNVSGLVNLIADVGSINETGALTAGVLTGSVVSTASFTGANGIGTLGNFAAPNGFTLNDGQSLSITGLVGSSSGTIAINTGNAGLGIPGSIAAQAVTLIAGSIDMGGSVGAVGVAELVANQGSIDETGSLTAGTLTGSAATTASFTGSNNVGTLASFSAPGGFTLTDGSALLVTGSVASSGGTVALNTGTFGLDVAGTITGAAAALTAGSIDLPGSLDLAGLASFVANQGSISQTGILNAGTVTGSAATTAQFTGTNQIGTLGDFSAPDGFSLTDGAALAVSGSVSASAGIVVLNTGTFGLGLGGAITGLAATLTAGSIDIGGSLGVTGIANLVANQGSIGETGSLTAGTLTGSAITAASFSGANHVATLGDFSAPSGFTLNDGQFLTVAGSVTASSGAVALNTGTFGLAVDGAIGGLSATLSAGSIDLGGSLGVSGVAALFASLGSIAETGSLTAGTLTGSAITTARFGGANQIGTLGNFSALGGFSLIDGRALTVAGLVTSAGSIAIDNAGNNLSVTGTIAGSPVLLRASEIDISGQVGTGAVTLVSTGSIDATGVIIATSLQGSAGSFASLTGANVVTTLNDFTAPTGFTLNNGHNLGIAGSILAVSGTVVLSNGTFALDIPGTITGSAVTLSAGTIGLTGSLNATGVASLTAVAGNITEAPTAFLNAGTLTGAVSGSASFAGTNAIGTLGLFSAPVGLTLDDTVNLTVAGAVTASSGTVVIDDGSADLSLTGGIGAAAVTLAAGSIAIDGSLGAAGLADLIARSAGVTETGMLNAGTLTGSAITAAALTGSNLVGTLAAFSAPNGFALNDNEALAVNGPLTASAGQVVLNTGTFGLGIAGGISALGATLTAGSISITGSLGVSGVASLTANQGAISETGSLTAGTLTGTAATTASLIGTNLIGTLGNFAAPLGLTLVDGQALTVAGQASATSGVVSIATGSFGLLVPGAVSGQSVTLTVGSIGIAGSVGAVGLADLVASAGAITETGSLNAGTLTGSALTTATFTGANLIGTLAAFNAPAGFSLNDGQALQVTGSVTAASGTIGIDTGTFALDVPATGVISGLAATLSAGTIGIIGRLGVTGVASLTALQGGISETGNLSAGTLTGSALTSASFTGVDAVGTLGDFLAPGGFTLLDGQALSVAGAVASAGGAILINTGAALLSVPGTISGQSVSLTAGTLGIGGSVGATGLLLLSVNGGTITETGVLSAGTLAGAASVATLTGASPTANQIGSLGNFSAGTLTLQDGMALTVAGSVSIGSLLSITDSGAISVTGAVLPNSGNIAVGLTGTALDVTGLVSAGTGGSLNLAFGGGAITEATGTLIAGLLTGSAGSATLTGPTNAIGTLGAFAAGSTLVVLDTGSLLVSGTVSAGALASITAPTITVASLVNAPNTTLSATAGALSLTGTVSATSAAVLNGVQGIAGGTGLLTGGGAVTATSSGGAVNLSNTLNAVGAINGSAATSFAFGDSTDLTIGQLNAGASVTIVDHGALTLAGTLAPLSGTAIAVGLTAQSMAINGLLSDGGGGTTTLIASPGGITETGTIIAGTLTASGTSLTLSSTNTIAALGNISGGPTLIIVDAIPLSVIGLATASSLASISAPALTVTGTVVAPSTTLTATTGTLGLSGTVNAATLALLSGAAGISGATGLITGGGALTAISGGGSVVLVNGSNSVSSVGGSAAGDFLFVNLGGVNVGDVTAGGVASVGAAAIDVLGTVAAPNIGLTAFSGDLRVDGAVNPSLFGTLSAANGAIVVPSGASIAPPPGFSAIQLGLSAQQIVIDGLVSDGGAGVTSLNVPRGGGTIQEDGTLIAGVLSGSAALANLGGAGFSNQIATLAAFSAGELVLNDGVDLTVAGPVTIGNMIAIQDTGALLVSGAIAPQSGAITVGLSAASMAITGLVSDGGAGTTSLVTFDGSIIETGALVAGTLSGSAAGGGAGFADVILIGANQIDTLAGFTSTGNLLLKDGTGLLVTGAVFAGTHGGLGGAGSTSAEIDVLGGNLTVASGGLIHAGLDGALTGNVTLRAGSDSVAGSVEIDGGLYAANGGAVAVTAGYNVNNNAWNVVGSGSTITLTGTLWGDLSGASPAGLVNLGAAGSIDEPVTAASIRTALLTGRAGGHVNLAETANGALASVTSANRIATLGSFISNAGTDDPLGFLLRDGMALTVTGPVVDGGASASRGIAISVVPGSGSTYTAADLIIAGKLQAQTTVNPQATGNVIETSSGSVVARTLTTQSGVIPSTEVQGNVAGTYPASVIAANASAFYGNASGQNVNQIGTLANVTTTGTLSLYDTPNLAVIGNVMTGVTPAASGNAGTVVIGTGMTLATPGLLSVSGTLAVGTQGGVMSLSGGSVSLGGGNGPATLSADTIQVFASSGVTTADRTVIYTGGDVFKRPATNQAPVDPGPATPGAHFLVGPSGFAGSGQLTVLPYTANNPAGAVGTTHPELDIRLTSGSGAVNFDFGNGLNASTASLLLSLGSSGTASGRVVANAAAVFYTNTSGPPTNLFATLFTSSGVSVSGQGAASQAYISKDGIFIPNSHFQVNACAISSINCVLISPFASVPIVNPLRDLPTEFLADEGDDPDLLIPNVSDRED